MEVILVPADTLDRNGVQRYFVEVKGVPHSRGALVVTAAIPLDRAEKVKRDIEDGLDAYRRPSRIARRRGKTVWQRLREE